MTMRKAKNENNFEGESFGGSILFKIAKEVLSDKIYFLPS